MRLHAASRNPYRILDRIGALEQYVREMDAISNAVGDGEADNT